MSGARKACIFCGSTTNKMSREHIFRSALREHAPDLGPMVFQDYETGISRELHTSVFDQVIRKVCRPCNEGWLERLERDAEPALLPLILGEGVKISPSEGASLARWAAKTNVTRGYGNRSRSITAAEVMKIRTHEDLSESWTVSIWRTEQPMLQDLARTFDNKVYDYDVRSPTDTKQFLGTLRVQEHILVIGHALIYSRWIQQPQDLRDDHIASWDRATKACGPRHQAVSPPATAPIDSEDLPVLGTEDIQRLASILPAAYKHQVNREWVHNTGKRVG